MAVGLPEQLARDALRRALQRAAHAAAFVCLATAIVVAVASAVSGGRPDSWSVLAALVVMAAALALVTLRPTVVSTVLYLAVGTGTVLLATVLVMSGDSPFATSNNVVLALPRVALVLVGGAGATTAIAVTWAVLGFVLGELAVLIGTGLVGATWAPNTAAAFATAVIVAIIVVDRAGRRARRERAGAWGVTSEERPADRRARELDSLAHRELRATARLHDTALMHLVAIASAGSGPVEDRLRTAIRQDLALIAGPDWAIGRSETSAHPGTSDRPGASARPAASAHAGTSDRPGTSGRPGASAQPGASARPEASATWLHLDQSMTAAEHVGLEVRLTGDVSALSAVTPERAAALDAAVAQCLVNVRRHAGVSVAEVAIGTDDRELTIAVMDAGVGFDEAAVPADRIGLRTSIRGRVEHVGGTVEVWSIRNVGTTVVLSVPTGTSA